jgi:TPR repeat protein
MQDEIQGVAWFMKAAEQGMPRAQSEVGTLLMTGRHTRALHAAANAGEDAIYNVPLSKKVKADPVQAFKWLTKAAKQGDAQGQLHLGCMLEEGKQFYPGIKKNVPKAAEWYAKAAAQGVAAAQFNLGRLYDDVDAGGAHIKQNLMRAAVLYEQAAQQGNVDAMFRLACMYGCGSGVVRNGVTARVWVKKAADLGHKRAKEKHREMKRYDLLTDAQKVEDGKKSIRHNPKGMMECAKNDLSPEEYETYCARHKFVQLEEQCKQQ